MMLPVRTTLSLALGCCLATPVAAEEAKSLPTLVVTATKQDQRKDQTAASVEVLDADALDRTHVDGLADLATQLPNVYYSGFTQNTPTLTIRGLGFSDDESDSSSIGVLLDGVPINATTSGQFFDLERIEVLRGPQSTLYGQNSMGGLVALRTRDPGTVFGGNLVAESGTGNRSKLTAAVDLPISANTSVRISAGGEHADGYTDNIALGRDDTGGWKSVFGRIKLLHRDDSDGTWRISLQHAQTQGGNDFFADPVLARRQQSDANQAGINDIRYTFFAADYSRALNGGQTLAVTLGATDSDWVYWVPSSVFAGANGFDQRNRQYSAEVRLSGDAGQLDWQSGAYASYLKRDAPYLYESSSYVSDTVAKVNGSTAAVFGEVGWRFDPRWRLSSALRVEYDTRIMDWTSSQASIYDTDGDGVAETYASTSRLDGVDVNDTVALPKLTLEFTPSEHQFAWLTLARGFKSSGFNLYAYADAAAAQAYKPEYGNYAELGYRLRGADDRWDIGTSLFYTALRDQQVVVTSNGQTMTSNAGRSHNRGLEMNANLRPGHDFELSAYYGFVEAQYDDYRNGSVAYDGQQFPLTPRYSYGASVRWHPQAWDVSLSASRIGSSQMYPQTSVSNDPYTMVDARIAYSVGPWTLAMFAKNLADARYFTRASSGVYVAAPPRTVGVSAGWVF
ncbi:MAG TPA: TonB-dependent receptor [Pseudoxanthomonas sp.]|nr:TonB-dependent receptor [Pseudoxanthomonas sp.]